MKRQSFAQEGGGTEFRQGLRVEKGTTNRLLSKLPRFAREGGKLPPPCTHPPRERDSRALKVIRTLRVLTTAPPKMKSWLRAWGRTRALAAAWHVDLLINRLTLHRLRRGYFGENAHFSNAAYNYTIIGR